jgi:hypothetical protein
MPIKVALAVAAVAMSAAATAMSAKASHDSQVSQMKQLGKQRDMAAVQAEDDALQRTRQLGQVVAASRASFAARGLNPDTGTPQMFAERQGLLAAEDSAVASLNASNQRDLYRLAINQSATNARNAMVIGVLKTGSTLLGGASDIASMGQGAGAGTGAGTGGSSESVG